MRRRLLRLLWMCLRPVRFVEVRQPHGSLAVGGRTTFHVVARGYGVIGFGHDIIEVAGHFDGPLSVPVTGDTAVIEARGLPWRQHKRLAVVAVEVPAAPPPVRPALPAVVAATTPTISLPPFSVSFEVP